MKYFTLSAPTQIVWIISTVLAILAAVVAYAGVAIPVVKDHLVPVLTVAYVVLWLGVVMKEL